MNKRFAALSLALGLVLAVAACAPQSTVVLVPDADGHVGRIEVAAKGQAVILDQANTASSTAKGGQPSAGKSLSPAEISTTWADALAIMPERPAAFQLYFNTGTAEVKSESMAVLDQAVAQALRRPHVLVMVAGHADATGSAEINDRISRQRAEVVRALLIERKIPADAIRTSSHGKRNPLYPTAEGMAEPRNRRVTVTIQ